MGKWGGEDRGEGVGKIVKRGRVKGCGGKGRRRMQGGGEGVGEGEGAGEGGGCGGRWLRVGEGDRKGGVSAVCF